MTNTSIFMPIIFQYQFTASCVIGQDKMMLSGDIFYEIPIQEYDIKKTKRAVLSNNPFS